jgi:glycosyltransferase involved in cell wall biosynthesis
MGPVLLTLGELHRDRGIEHAIAALPAILRRFPDAVYLVVGATAPTIRDEEGEKYREQLKLQAARLGVREHVCFVDRPWDTEESARYLAASDLYLNPGAMRDVLYDDGLAWAMVAGKPVVATPSPYAEELAEEGAGLLTAFGDSRALTAQVFRLLMTSELRARLERRAWRLGRKMVWTTVGRSYYDLLRDVVAEDSRTTVGGEGIHRVSGMDLKAWSGR